MGGSFSQQLSSNGSGSVGLVAAEHTLSDGSKVIGRAKVSPPSPSWNFYPARASKGRTAEALWFRPSSVDKTNDLFVWGGTLSRLEKDAQLPCHSPSWYYWIGFIAGIFVTIFAVSMLSLLFELEAGVAKFVVVVLGNLVLIALTILLASWCHTKSDEYKNAVEQSKDAVDAAIPRLRAILPTGYTLTTYNDEAHPSTTLIDLVRSATAVESLPPVDHAVELQQHLLPLSLDTFTQNARYTSFDIWTHGAIMVTLRTTLEPYTKAEERMQFALAGYLFTFYICWMNADALTGNAGVGKWLAFLLAIGGTILICSFVELYSNFVEGPVRHAKCQQSLAEIAPAVYERIGCQMTYDIVPIHCMGMTRGVLRFSTTTTPTTTTGVNLV